MDRELKLSASAMCFVGSVLVFDGLMAKVTRKHFDFFRDEN